MTMRRPVSNFGSIWPGRRGNLKRMQNAYTVDDHKVKVSILQRKERKIFRQKQIYSRLQSRCTDESCRNRVQCISNYFISTTRLSSMNNSLISGCFMSSNKFHVIFYSFFTHSSTNAFIRKLRVGVELQILPGFVENGGFP